MSDETDYRITDIRLAELRKQVGLDVARLAKEAAGVALTTIVEEACRSEKLELQQQKVELELREKNLKLRMEEREREIVDSLWLRPVFDSDGTIEFHFGSAGEFRSHNAPELRTLLEELIPYGGRAPIDGLSEEEDAPKQFSNLADDFLDAAEILDAVAAKFRRHARKLVACSRGVSELTDLSSEDSDSAEKE